MKRKTVHKNSFPTLSWFFISSLGSNLPLPVVGSGIVNDCSLGYSYRSKFSLLHNRACGMGYHTFCNTHVDHVTILAPFTILPHIHKSIFILGWTEICPSSLTWHIAFCSDTCKRQQSSFWYPTHYLLVCIAVCCTPEHTHKARTSFWHFQQLSSKRKTHPG